MIANYTQREKIFIFHPGDELLAIHDWYPYAVNKPIVVEPETNHMYITLSLKAKGHKWNLENKLEGKKTRSEELIKVN